jgi:hypothetical protein
VIVIKKRNYFSIFLSVNYWILGVIEVFDGQLSSVGYLPFMFDTSGELFFISLGLSFISVVSAILAVRWLVARKINRMIGIMFLIASCSYLILQVILWYMWFCIVVRIT